MFSDYYLLTEIMLLNDCWFGSTYLHFNEILLPYNLILMLRVFSNYSCCRGCTKCTMSIKRLRLQFVPHIVSGIPLTLWEGFWLHLGFPRHCCSQYGRQKQKFAVRSRSNFFSNFGDFISSFNPVFCFYFKNINFFEIGPKLTFLRCFFYGTNFFAEEFLLS